MTDAPTALPVAAVIEASRQMLQKQLYAIFTTPVAGLGPVLAQMEDHLAFQVALERDGILFAAGPMWSDDERDWHGEGLVVVRAGSRAEAEAIAVRDPMHASGARTFRVRPWMINEGTMTVRLDLSSQRFVVV
ncbi:YciI family protein [Polymorphum gilvum]|uniref:YCII-related domain family n=1 Tax=Polymorphum gilvum (strain LMG 25793 / CGMCC 1.9160 / SL003B-26A1) TaxID=991905 RepID=F2J2I3_POLGS|nr:YciI family protein [Polymorphum gilvum]ADZ70897.1 YCII-related domain family [Polymorphum gilvum SL003B-26A1]